MFYDTFIQLCEQNGEKPTPVLKQLQLSPGNLEKWKNGATVNSEVLLKLSEHFGVSVDYLLTGKKGPSHDKFDDLSDFEKLENQLRNKFSTPDNNGVNPLINQFAESTIKICVETIKEWEEIKKNSSK